VRERAWRRTAAAPDFVPAAFATAAAHIASGNDVNPTNHQNCTQCIYSQKQNTSNEKLQAITVSREKTRLQQLRKTTIAYPSICGGTWGCASFVCLSENYLVQGRHSKAPELLPTFMLHICLLRNFKFCTLGDFYSPQILLFSLQVAFAQTISVHQTVPKLKAYSKEHEKNPTHPQTLKAISYPKKCRRKLLCAMERRQPPPAPPPVFLFSQNFLSHCCKSREFRNPDIDSTLAIPLLLKNSTHRGDQRQIATP